MSNQHVKEMEDFYNEVEGSKRAPPPAEQKVRLESEEVVATSTEPKDEVEDWDAEVAAKRKAERESEEAATTSTSTKQKVENGRESEEEDWDAESEAEREAEWESDLREMNNGIRNMLKQRIMERDENGTVDHCMMIRRRSLSCICWHCLTRTYYAESTCRRLPRKCQ
jgi:vacuolar-type H+-ATPase subunit I/STV1